MNLKRSGYPLLYFLYKVVSYDTYCVFLLGIATIAIVFGFVTLLFYSWWYILWFIFEIMLIIFPFVLGYIVYKVMSAVIETWGVKEE